ncbi:replication associated protein [Lake Sarah-associated circular virus-41]|uniref:Replication-associated protein n=1 Tax=Lake Sarah-associated circular virus-41 TaxID=1685770 RepID=A0A126GA81_9VIRU|nr:replication associated protein [Lake Sarah-associated circular virus-41]ALE29781.1 replication associated protein [Lake Sarah-associated circular virus-41]ALE29784.1 replication associated protein [Lake Sarah-associated circular virus-41]
MANGKSTRRQGIFWLCTIPSPNEVCAQLELGTLPVGLVWCKGQKERGSGTGYEHYQLVAAFAKKVSLPGVVGMFGRGTHGELSRSEAANEYVGKEETRIGTTFELGAKPIRRNSKTDWESVWTAAKSGDLSAVPANVRVVNYHALRAIRSDHAVPVGVERTVHVFWGSTGTGKSRRAWEEAGIDAYTKCPRSKFWDGYQDQQHVVVDEFRGGIDVAHLLRWFDRYPVRVEIKGSSRPLVANTIWITSNKDPVEWYPELDLATLEALLRRLTIVHFP